MKTERTLSVTLPGKDEIAITRIFDAPRELVFRTLTEPELIKRWLGPPRMTLEHCEMDLKVGGKFRFEGRHAGGTMGWGGVIREVDPPHKMVHTELFDEDWTGGETVVTSTLTEEVGQTTLTVKIKYSSPEARELALKTPMTEGIAESYANLDELLESLA